MGRGLSFVYARWAGSMVPAHRIINGGYGGRPLRSRDAERATGQEDLGNERPAQEQLRISGMGWETVISERGRRVVAFVRIIADVAKSTQGDNALRNKFFILRFRVSSTALIFNCISLASATCGSLMWCLPITIKTSKSSKTPSRGSSRCPRVRQGYRVPARTAWTTPLR